MAKIYLEAIEIVPMGEEVEFIRAEVTDKTEVEIVEIKAAVKDIMAGVNYRLTRHICHHDMGGACETKGEI